MAILPKVKLKAVVSFPAAVFGGAGIAVRQESGKFYFDLAFGELAQVATVPVPALPTTFFALWESSADTYRRMNVKDFNTQFGGGIPEAPNDGVQYGRQSLGWTPTSGGGGGIPEAPSDGFAYGRLNAAWARALALAGGTMTGALVLNADPAAALGAATKQYVDAAIVQNYITGLTLSTTASSSSFQVAAGMAANNTNAVYMKLAASVQKNTGPWSVGINGGAMQPGALAGSTFYHVWLIRRPDTGVVDILCDLATVLTPVLPSGYTQYRRIGSIKTDGANNWTRFVQRGDYFLWDVSVNDVSSAAIGTTAIPTATATPPSIRTKGIYNVAVLSPAAGHGLLVSSMDISDQVPTGGNLNVGFVQVASGVSLCRVDEITDTSRQIRVRASVAGCNYWVWTVGWQDFLRREGL